MTKSPEAFKSISEVAEILQVDTHVLRFWEGKFKQVQPIKNASGRRLYRPEDIALIEGIKHLLHDKGMTIKGVQKLLKEIPSYLHPNPGEFCSVTAFDCYSRWYCTFSAAVVVIIIRVVYFPSSVFLFLAPL